VYEAGGWRVDGTGIERYGQSTPRQALLGFLRAFERKRYDIIMRYVPDKERQGAAELGWGPAGKAATAAAQQVSPAPGATAASSGAAAAPSAEPSAGAPSATPKPASSAEPAATGSGAKATAEALQT